MRHTSVLPPVVAMLQPLKLDAVSICALVNPVPGHELLNGVTFVIVALVVIGITYLSMRGSETLTKWFGETGIDAVGRIVGIVVAAIAVQLVVNGVSSLTNLKIH